MKLVLRPIVYGAPSSRHSQNCLQLDAYVVIYPYITFPALLFRPGTMRITTMLKIQGERMVEFILEGCLKSIAQKDSVQLSIDSPVPLTDLLDELQTHLQGLIPYGSQTTDTQLLSNLAFYRSNRMLHIDDMIRIDDQISVLLPATGG